MTQASPSSAATLNGASGTVLFVDDEAALRHAATQALELAELSVVTCDRAEAALPHLDPAFPGVLVSDIRMPGMDGIALMQHALGVDPELPVILVTGHGDVALAVQAMREGAYDFIEKPYAPARLIDTIRRALDKRALTLENRRLRSLAHAHHADDPVAARLTGSSPVMTRLRAQLRAVAASDADVLIEGATGTGKEVATRALHDASARKARPFTLVNCAALPDALIESELFGHEAGAFPGATRPRYGKFEHARGGTVFLDEIDSLPLGVQGKLLHAIETRQITRLGSNDPVPLDIRFVAASKLDLAAEAARGAFRSDLLYRLNVVTLRLPTLEDRREDIAPLFLELLGAVAAARGGMTPPEVAPGLLRALAARAWPGNVRELRNVAERHVMGLDPIDINPTSSDAGESLAAQMAAHEKALIAATLASHGGSLKACYTALGLSRKALYEKMQKHGLSREDFRSDAPDQG